MVFWLVTGGIVAAALFLLASAVLRARESTEAPAAYDLRVYRDQLSEVERDVARGVLEEADAERVRVEVSRRILAADAAMATESAKPGVGSASSLVLAGLGLLALAGTYGLYVSLGAPGYGDLALQDRIAMAEEARQIRPDQATAEQSVPPMPPPADSADYAARLADVRALLAERPEDLRGFRILARGEASLGNFKAAHEAQARVIELSGGPDADPSDWSQYAEMLVLAAGGYVSPEAEQALEQVLQHDPVNPSALYYWGLMMRQTGRPDRAFRIWDSILRRSDGTEPWIPPIMAQIDDMAQLAGFAGYEPPQFQSPRGPTAEDLAAAEEMSPEERMAMIEGMVGGLADRLADEGGPPEDWARLITALSVLGRVEDAAMILADARETFAENPGAIDVINRAAERSGL